MQRPISLRAAALATLVIMGVLLVTGIINPPGGVRADTASSAASAAALGSASAMAGGTGTRVTDTRMLVSVVLPAGWQSQPQMTTDTITLALIGPGPQTFSVGVLDNLTDLNAAAQAAIASTRGDADTISVGDASDATVGAEHAITFTATVRSTSDPTVTVTETRWVVVHGSQTFILVARGTMPPLTDAQAIVSSLLFGSAMTTATPTPRSAASPAAASATSAGSGQVVTNTDTDPVNVRAMPNTDSAIIVQIASGESAAVLMTGVPGSGNDATWIRVSYGGKTGYVRADVVSAPHAGTATPATVTP